MIVDLNPIAVITVNYNVIFIKMVDFGEIEAVSVE